MHVPAIILLGQFPQIISQLVTILYLIDVAFFKTCIRLYQNMSFSDKSIKIFWEVPPLPHFTHGQILQVKFHSFPSWHCKRLWRDAVWQEKEPPPLLDDLLPSAVTRCPTIFPQVYVHVLGVLAMQFVGLADRCFVLLEKRFLMIIYNTYCRKQLTVFVGNVILTPITFAREDNWG